MRGSWAFEQIKVALSAGKIGGPEISIAAVSYAGNTPGQTMNPDDSFHARTLNNTVLRFHICVDRFNNHGS
jgi:hypothetical protein